MNVVVSEYRVAILHPRNVAVSQTSYLQDASPTYARLEHLVHFQHHISMAEYLALQHQKQGTPEFHELESEGVPLVLVYERVVC